MLHLYRKSTIQDRSVTNTPICEAVQLLEVSSNWYLYSCGYVVPQDPTDTAFHEKALGCLPPRRYERSVIVIVQEDYCGEHFVHSHIYREIGDAPKLSPSCGSYSFAPYLQHKSWTRSDDL